MNRDCSDGCPQTHTRECSPARRSAEGIGVRKTGAIKSPMTRPAYARPGRLAVDDRARVESRMVDTRCANEYPTLIHSRIIEVGPAESYNRSQENSNRTRNSWSYRDSPRFAETGATHRECVPES